MRFFTPIKILNEQNSTFLKSIGAVAAIFLIGIIIWQPLQKEETLLKTELTDIQNKIQRIEISTDQKNKTKEEIINVFKKKYGHIDEKFPPTEEESLNLLSVYAQELNLEVISVRSLPKKPFVDQDQQKVGSGAKFCQEISVSMELKGSHQGLVQYLETIKELLPAYVTVERLKIHKDIPAEPKLNIQLELNLYLLS